MFRRERERDAFERPMVFAETEIVLVDQGVIPSPHNQRPISRGPHGYSQLVFRRQANAA